MTQGTELKWRQQKREPADKKVQLCQLKEEDETQPTVRKDRSKAPKEQ